MIELGDKLPGSVIDQESFAWPLDAHYRVHLSKTGRSSVCRGKIHNSTATAKMSKSNKMRETARRRTGNNRIGNLQSRLLNVLKPVEIGETAVTNTAPRGAC